MCPCRPASSAAGIFTGLAIALHNIPEGLATFVGALNDAKARAGAGAGARGMLQAGDAKKEGMQRITAAQRQLVANGRRATAACALQVGASIAAAIAIHNIPEGICVAMPIYYATGSKWKVRQGMQRCFPQSSCRLGTLFFFFCCVENLYH